MNVLWTILFMASVIFFVFKNPEMMLSVGVQSIHNSLLVCFSLAEVYIFWMGIMKVAQDSGLANKLAKLLMPIIYLLFGNVGKEVAELISLNISANLLGLSNASLPAGIEAMVKLNNKNGVLTRQMAMLFALNCCSIQLLPSTIILLRSDGGSVSSGDVILPIIIVSLICFVMVVVMIKVLYRNKVLS